MTSIAMKIIRAQFLKRAGAIALLGMLIVSFSNHAETKSQSLSVDDFSFNEPLGSQGTTIEKIGENHFKVILSHAPQHPDWCNKLQFRIKRHAKGNALKLDVVFLGGDRYIFNEYFHSWSYDGENWTPVHWTRNSTNSAEGDTLIFPTFTEDSVIVGHQVPLSYKDLESLIDHWRQSPFIQVHVIGQSLGGRNIYRLTITDPKSPHPVGKRWVHYFANQHPGEHNSQWRMAGMIDWLLSPEAEEDRARSVCHFIPMMSPDAPSNGWYRVNAQGVDMNRSYFVNGADAEKQAHEAYLCQKDLEALMASDAPVTDLWSMHTWGGIVEPIIIPGPEIGAQAGPWTELKKIMGRNDPHQLVKPLAKSKTTDPNPTYWTNGPHLQFGITAILCEGGGALFTKQENIDSGVVLMKSLLQFYRGLKR